MIPANNMLIFAPTMAVDMKTITLRYDPKSEFGIELDRLIRNSKDVSVIKRKKTKKKQTHLDKAIREIKEGKILSYDSVDELFADLGI